MRATALGLCMLLLGSVPLRNLQLSDIPIQLPNWWHGRIDFRYERPSRACLRDKLELSSLPPSSLSHFARVKIDHEQSEYFPDEPKEYLDWPVTIRINDSSYSYAEPRPHARDVFFVLSCKGAEFAVRELHDEVPLAY